MSDTVVGADRPAGEPRRGDAPKSRAARIALFYRQVVAEMRKVIWPTRRELITYTTVVVVFVTVMALLIAGVDVVFTRLVLTVFG